MQREIDLKRFKKIKRIRKSGFGLVYQIQEKKTGELYAAKVLDCDDDEDKCNEMINREISILMCTKHPTIIKFIGYSKLDFQGENNVTIIMELAKKGSLREVLRQIQQNHGPANYTNTTRQILLVGIARGMKYLHDRNIIHRDIKPENILLDENLQPHITDFGLLKFGGTLIYKAPEILKEQKYDSKVDVYSFSILMFEVLTDSVPYPELFNGEMSEYGFMYKVANKSYRPKFSVPVKRSLRNLIEQCWSENPSDRPTFDEIFNKLSNKTGDDDDDEENFLLEDVDTDKLNLYVKDITKITGSKEKFLSQISALEEDDKQLKSKNEKQKTKNKKQSNTNKTLKKGNKLSNKTGDDDDDDENFLLEDSDDDELKLYFKDKTDSREKFLSQISALDEDDKQLKSKNEKQKTKPRKQSDTNKQLEEDDKQLKSENEKQKTKNRKRLGLIKYIKEKGHKKSKNDQKRSENEDEKREAKSKRTKTNEKQLGTTQIIVGGTDASNQIGERPNDISDYEVPIISPPLNLPLDTSTLVSYSVFFDHSVLVTRSGSMLGIGSNYDQKILSLFEKGSSSDGSAKYNKITKFSQFTEFSVKDESGRQLAPISAVCTYRGTLYMFSKISGNGRQLVYFNWYINCGDQIFLDIGDEEPVSLFGGCYNAAAITDKGEVIFINRDAVENSPKSRIEAVSLPDGEKASSVACLNESVFVLSSNGRVFSSEIESESNVVRFSEVSELSGYEIVWVSGTLKHCLVVSKEGRVFGFGSNEDGQLGLGEETKSVSSFTEISSLLEYEIRAAYAGNFHSLFETREGKILSCGFNLSGQLLLRSGRSREVYSPRETVITGGATFCIAGASLSVVFVGGNPPPNTPNMPIQHHQ